MAEYIIRPRLHNQATIVKKLLESLTGNLEQELADVDRNRKQNLIEDLQALYDLLITGRTGLGRAPFGMVISNHRSLEWASQYPYNLFKTPVLIAREGKTAEQIQGLIQGYLRHTLDNLRLIRRATLETKNRYTPGKHDQEIANLNWSSLRALEKALMPPVLWFADAAKFSASEQAGLLRLLSSGLPVKIILLSSGEAPEGISPEEIQLQQASMLFAANNLPGTTVFQGSMEDLPALFDGLQEGLKSQTPALCYLLASRYKGKETIWPDVEKIIEGMALGKQLKQALEDEFTQKNEKEIQRLKQEYEEKIERLEQEYMAAIRVKLKDNLLALARRNEK